MTERSREDDIFIRAESLGWRLIPPTGDEWLLINRDIDSGDALFGSLDLIEKRLAASEEGTEDALPWLIIRD